MADRQKDGQKVERARDIGKETEIARERQANRQADRQADDLAQRNRQNKRRETELETKRYPDGGGDGR